MRILTWVLFMSLISVIHFLAYKFGIFGLIEYYDFTRISCLIIGCFGAGAVLTAVCVHRKQFGWSSLGVSDAVKRMIRVTNFLATHMLTLGMIGTVIGMIYILHTCFVGIDVKDIESTQEALTKMSSGMGTAFITTAAGLIYSLFLKLLLLTVEAE